MMSPPLDEWLVTEVLRQPIMLFVLWAIRTDLCATTDQFRHHFGAELPIEDLIDELREHKLLRENATKLELSELGEQIVALFIDLGASELPDEVVAKPDENIQETPRSKPASPATGAMELRAPRPLKVVVVGKQPVFRRGLKVALLESPDIAVVGDVSGGQEALDLLAHIYPDVIVMDLELPDMGGIRTLRAIRDLAPLTNVIVLSDIYKGELVQDALTAGAIGYLLKDVDIDELINAVHSAAAGIPILASAAAQALVRASGTASKGGGDLSVREREVLALVTRGLSNQEIASQLVITVSTMKRHLSNIYQKLGVKSRTQMVAVALTEQLVPMPSMDLETRSNAPG